MCGWILGTDWRSIRQLLSLFRLVKNGRDNLVIGSNFQNVGHYISILRGILYDIFTGEAEGSRVFQRYKSFFLKQHIADRD